MSENMKFKLHRVEQDISHVDLCGITYIIYTSIQLCSAKLLMNSDFKRR